jgi:hypothetical protein
VEYVAAHRLDVKYADVPMCCPFAVRTRARPLRA